MQPDIKIQLFVDKRPEGILHYGARKFGDKPEFDFYINVPLYKTTNLIDDYVQISVDPSRFKVERQLINPYFIELGFFETVGEVKEIEDKAGTFGIKINK